MAATSLNTPYIVITGTIVAAVVIIFSILQPMLADIRDINNRITTTTSVVTEKQEFLRGLDRKREELQIQRVHEERLNVILPNSSSYDEMVRVLSLSASNAGLTVQKVENKSSALQSSVNGARARGEKINIPAGVTPIAAEIDVIGTYQQLRAFLSNLEKSPRLTDVTKISSKSSETQSDLITSKLIIQSYFRQQ